MTDDIVSRLRDTGFCGVRAQQEAADEIERLRLACHFLAGWISYHDRTIDAKEAVATAYDKAGQYV